MIDPASWLTHADPAAPALFLPFVGEFGFQVMWHARFVHFHRAAKKIVCCRVRDQALYPSAAEFDTDWVDPVKDAFRVGTQRHMGGPLTWPALIRRHPGCAVYPGGPPTTDEVMACSIALADTIPFRPAIKRSLRCDVLIGTRDRAFASEKNWPHWERVAAALADAGLTFGVMGARATSRDLPGQQFHTGDFDTAASIEALQSCRLYAGTDSGGSHLASEVGARMVVFRLKSHRDWIGRMAAVNPGRVMTVEDGWRHPEAVIAEIFRAVGETRGQRSEVGETRGQRSEVGETRGQRSEVGGRQMRRPPISDL